MFPELFRIGNFPINTYGILLAVGILLALYAAARLAQKDGISKDRIYDLGLWTVVGGLLGSKVLMFIVYPDVKFFSLDFLQSGGVFYGGLIGGFLTLLLLIRFYKLPFWKVADAFAPGVALGQAFGRQGCFAAGCCWGKPTDSIFGVHFTEQASRFTGVPIYGPDGGPLHLHPTQLYESLTMFLVFGLLIYLHGKKKFDGQILIIYGIIYAVVRFSIEFFRNDPRGDLFGINTATGLSTSQLISLGVALVAVVFFLIRRNQKAEGQS
jgi:phosphatidylglycerol:prolipoprotein diacylglycerol transferase